MKRSNSFLLNVFDYNKHKNELKAGEALISVDYNGDDPCRSD